MDLLSEDFLDKGVCSFPIAHFNVQVSHKCRSGVQEVFDVAVGDGASQAGIFDGTTEGSSKKFSSVKEVEEKENCGVSSSAPLCLRLAGLRSAINQD